MLVNTKRSDIFNNYVNTPIERINYQGGATIGGISKDFFFECKTYFPNIQKQGDEAHETDIKQQNIVLIETFIQFLRSKQNFTDELNKDIPKDLLILNKVFNRFRKIQEF